MAGGIALLGIASWVRIVVGVSAGRRVAEDTGLPDAGCTWDCVAWDCLAGGIASSGIVPTHKKTNQLER